MATYAGQTGRAGSRSAPATQPPGLSSSPLPHRPSRPALAGLAVMAMSVIWLGIATTWNRYEFLVLALLINGFFQPLLFVPPMRVVMGAVPAESVVVEDTVAGVTAGVAAGMRVLAYTADPHTDTAALQAAGAEPFDRMEDLPLLVLAPAST